MLLIALAYHCYFTDLQVPHVKLDSCHDKNAVIGLKAVHLSQRLG